MQLVILSGPPNAGKSATAEALCQRYDRMLHIQVRVLRDFLRMGRLRPWDASPDGRRQERLLIGAACDMARRFLQAGYGVIIDDIVTAAELPVYARELEGAAAPVHFIVLRPALDVLLEREASRPTEWHRAGHLERVYESFASWEGVTVVDPDALAPDLVADRVMALAAAGSALMSRAGR